MPKPMGLELKVKEKNTTVLKHRLSGAGQDLGRISLASGRRARMRWGHGKSKEEMRIHSGGSARSE